MSSLSPRCGQRVFWNDSLLTTARPSCGVPVDFKFAGLKLLAATVVALAVAASGCERKEEAPSIVSARYALTAQTTTNASNFNGTAIPAGRTIWFSSVMKVSGVGTAPAHLYFNGSSITFTAGGTNYAVAVAAAEVTINPAVSVASTVFDATSNAWLTVLPKTFSGNALLTGVAFPVTVALPGGINPVTWSGKNSPPTSTACP